MNRIYKNDADFVVVEYENTGDYEKDYGIESFLRSADFDHDEKKGQWVFVGSENLKVRSIIKAIVDFFEHEMGLAIELDQHCRKEVEEEMVAADVYAQAQVIGRKVIDASSVEPELPDFFKRTLMPYQRKSVEHVIQVGNAANFSVPGSGKTTITYAAISSWINDGIINKIMVVGPSASFGPWEEEFALCFGRPPKKLRLSRGIIHELESIGSVYELFICGYQLMANYAYQINRFLKKYKVALIIDESHNIKNPTGGARANAALQISPSATRRIILSGTPMPNDHRDLWTQITFLWPFNEPLGKQVAFNDYVRSNGIGKYRDIIGTLFCRIKKRDLDLPDPKWKEIVVPLNKYQRKIYDIIAVKTLKELSDYQDQATIQQFRMGKMVRLIQAASNPSLLFERAHDFEVGYPVDIDAISSRDVGIVELIRSYSSFEIPSKLVKLKQITEELLGSGNKVIIWTSFLNNIDVLQYHLLKDRKPIVIDGRVSKDEEDEYNREIRIREFKNDPNPRVLIATPPSLGESVSLHKNEKGEEVCRHAIYLDRNFNAGQYMQSMDRIHRLGMKNDAVVHYWLLMGQNTIDEMINKRLNEKRDAMYDALNDDFAVLDFNVTAKTISQQEFELDYQAVLEHLRKQKKIIDDAKEA